MSIVNLDFSLFIHEHQVFFFSWLFWLLRGVCWCLNWCYVAWNIMLHTHINYHSISHMVYTFSWLWLLFGLEFLCQLWSVYSDCAFVCSALSCVPWLDIRTKKNSLCLHWERERVGFGVPSLLTLFSEVYAAHGHRHKANHTNLVSVMIYTSISPKLAILDFTHNRVFSGILLVSWSVSQI